MNAGRVRIGRLWVDPVTAGEALVRILELIDNREGGAVFTPNTDHVMLCETDDRFREAYERASLCVADGMPLVWASRLIGQPLPERVAGSELVWPLALLAASYGHRLYLLGGSPGVAEAAAAIFQGATGVRVAGHSAPRIGIEPLPDEPAVLEDIRACRPDVVFVALGAPKQELWIDRVREALRPAVLLGIGAGLDFVAGRVPRAPAWMSRSGFEWLFRLAKEPRRLAYRYLVRDPQFALILWRMKRKGLQG